MWNQSRVEHEGMDETLESVCTFVNLSLTVMLLPGDIVNIGSL